MRSSLLEIIKVKATMIHSILSELKNNHGMNLVLLDLWNLLTYLTINKSFGNLCQLPGLHPPLSFDISIEAPKMEKSLITKDSSILQKMISHRLLQCKFEFLVF